MNADKQGYLERQIFFHLRLSAFICGFFLFFLSFSSADPAWWASRNVIETNAPVADFSPMIMGQLKWMATNACAELQVNLPNGAGSNVQNLVQGFSNTNNWLTANIGQIKSVAAPFYDRLIAEGYTNSYPWTGAASTNDYALGNLGQLKHLFSFDLLLDSDSDDMRDWWETHWFGSITNETGSGDFDSDGLSNSNEYFWSVCPTNTDTDVDGIADGMEVDNRTDPNNNDTTAPVITISWPQNNSTWTILP